MKSSTRHILRTARVLCWLVLLGCIPGCGDRTSGMDASTSGPQVRIVSLSPALSQILMDLGHQDLIVGCTPWAPAGLERVPVVGDLLRPDLERISAVRPDLILVQPTQLGVDPGLAQLAAQRGWAIRSWTLNRLEDIEVVLEELPESLRVAGVDPAPMLSSIQQWRKRRDLLLVPDPKVEALGETVVLFGIDPPMAFGRETYLNDLLESLGGLNAIRAPGYLESSLEDLVVLAPRSVVILATSPGSALEQAAQLRTMLGASAEGLDIHAIDGADLLVPGTRLLDGVQRFRARLEERP